MSNMQMEVLEKAFLHPYSLSHHVYSGHDIVMIRCRECSKPGYQPFAGASDVEFWIKQNDGSVSWLLSPEVVDMRGLGMTQ
jgi:hypothetical protein